MKTKTKTIADVQAERLVSRYDLTLAERQQMAKNLLEQQQLIRKLSNALSGIMYHFVPMQGNLKVEQEMIDQANEVLTEVSFV